MFDQFDTKETLRDVPVDFESVIKCSYTLMSAAVGQAPEDVIAACLLSAYGLIHGPGSLGRDQLPILVKFVTDVSAYVSLYNVGGTPTIEVPFGQLPN